MNIVILILILLYNFSKEKLFPKLISLKEETYSKEYINLINFIKNNDGYVNPKLFPNELSKINRFITSKVKINKNEKLLFIPSKISISKLNEQVNKKCLEVYGFNEDYDYACIVYFMTIDKYNSSSIFKPYYDYLPIVNNSDFITDFTQKEIEAFKETGITDGIKKYYYFYEMALEPVKDKLKKLANSKNIKYNDILGEFKYNYDMALTRNFGRPGSYYDINTMVPFLDLLNHSDKNNTHWIYEDKKEGYTLIAVRDIEKGEEVTVTYGRFYNSLLYKNYGFVIPGNIYHEKMKVNICNNAFILSIDSLNETIQNIFGKTLFFGKNLTTNDAKKYILNDLNNKRNYYLHLRTNRFSMNIIINEHLEILNKYIDEIENFN